MTSNDMRRRRVAPPPSGVIPRTTQPRATLRIPRPGAAGLQALVLRAAYVTVFWQSLILLPAGCRSYDGDKVRREHVEEYPQTLLARTKEILDPHQTLGLEDCIRVAMENNLDARTAAMDKRIARLQRDIAFASFLPTVSVSYSDYEFDPQISLPLSDTQTMNLDNVRSLVWNGSISVFHPATWFLYGAHRRGEEIADLLGLYTRQMVAMEVTARYFECLTLEQTERSLVADVEAADALRDDVIAFRKEGLASAWQADHAAVNAQARRAELARTQRMRRQANCALLAAMGLSPLAEISLAGQAPIVPPLGSTEELILEAMLNHPSLQIADRRIAIEKEKVKIAISRFLPVLSAFVYYPDSIETSLMPSNQWIYGLAGTMTLFDGFANINEYKAARERRKQSFVAREQTTLTLMLEVIRARQNLDTAQDQLDLARRARRVADARYAEMREKWKEGLIGSADILHEAAQRSKSQMQALAAEFQYQVAAATLLNVMGKTETYTEDDEHDGQSK
ncbi:MAG TPA: TolC family protein [Sedimentisphaerales bacterium]|nr:TolC family protein [Sedimentisphaerales bacterium]HNU29921.1 TolC family protein [Sedimentisphaerales bacterium]